MRTSPQASPSPTDTAIAIVGMSCRFPGDVNSPADFHEFLVRGGDGIVPVPHDRWENEAYYDPDREKRNRMYVDRGGFLRNIDQFDPLFFGISPAEAAILDPQHRWLLELTWEALEDAGFPARQLRGSDTSVYIGQFMHDYEQLQLDSMAHEEMTAHTATGPSMTLTANRISYTFDFKGPSMTLDTACSSSLVAIDLACRSILQGDSRAAVAGGVNILLRPELTMSICRASMLSPDGRCKSFDASANGYVRSEGAGVLILKSLADAQRDGDRIHAVIRASGVNQDGQTPGITVPSGAAQSALVRKTLARAGLTGADIHYVEAHGTGTAVGDPIEVNALSAIVGQRPASVPECIIGSVKSNIGHSEAAAGVAGVIKTVMALKRGAIPGNLHLQQRNPAIVLNNLRVRLADVTQPWPDTAGQPRRALVNSFGFGGTNANVVLEQAPSPRSSAADARRSHSALHVLPLGARSESALKELAARYRDLLSTKPDTRSVSNQGMQPALQDICRSAGMHREHGKLRLAATGSNAGEIAASLERFIAGEADNNCITCGPSADTPPRLCFVYSGMGTQWLRMGESLYRSEPVFRATLDRCSAALERLAGWSLSALLYSETTTSIGETFLAQPAIFAIQAALTDLLASWDIVPEAVVGHSAGEVCAAYAAGALSFDDAITVIFHRSRLQQTTEGLGTMLAVGLPVARLAPYLRGAEGKVSLAAINSGEALTLAGDQELLSQIARRLEADGVFARFLKVGVPYHSPVMDRLREPLIEALSGIRVHPPKLALFSTVTGAPSGEGDWRPEYWTKNVREPVLFQAAVEAALRAGFNGFVEIAPHAALASSVQKILAQQKSRGFCVTTLRRDQDAAAVLGQCLGALHVNGFPLPWEKLHPEGGFVDLPLYPWERSSHWHEAPQVKRARLKNVGGQDAFSDPVHPLLGCRLESNTPLWRKRVNLQEQAYLADHQVESEPVYPAAAYIEMFLAIQPPSDGGVTLREIEFKRALFLSRERPTLLETTHAGDEARISALDPQSGLWSVHSRAHRGDKPPAAAPRMDLAALRRPLTQAIDRDSFYEHCRKLGLTYQGVFRPVQAAWRGDGEALVEIRLALDHAADPHHLHPALLDGGFQAVFPLLDAGFLPVHIPELRYHRKPGSHCFCLVRRTGQTDTTVTGDLWLLDPDGTVCVEMFGVELHVTQGSATDERPVLHQLVWEAVGNTSARDVTRAQIKITSGQWLILGQPSEEVRRLSLALDQQGLRSETLHFAETSEVTFDNAGVVPSAVRMLEQLGKLSQDCCGIIDLRAFDLPVTDESSSTEVFDRTQAATVGALHLLQALEQLELQDSIPLVVVTRAAHPITPEDGAADPVQGSLWGLMRVAASEFPSLRLTLVDLPASGASDQDLDALAARLGEPAGETETELALRGGQAFAQRLKVTGEAELQRQAETRLEPLAGRNWRITGAAEAEGGVILAVGPNSVPEAGTLHLQVHCAGVRNSDWPPASASDCKALQAVAGYAESMAMPGSASRHRPSDTVAGLSWSEPGSSAVLIPDCSVKLPATVSAKTGVQLAGVFLPACLAVRHLAAVRSGDTVLLHGLPHALTSAMLQLAMREGASVVVAASTTAERERLLGLGAEAVYDPNNYNWVDRLAARIGSRGIDVLLGASNGGQAERLASLLKPFGRIVDFGFGHPPVAGAKSCSYQRFDLRDFVGQRPEQCRDALAEVVELLEQGRLQPTESAVLDAREFAGPAVRVVDRDPLDLTLLDFSTAPERVAPGTNPERVHANRTYLISGGLGGLGLQVMEWLVGKGAKWIVLTGRSAPGPEASAAIERAAARGVVVTPFRADVTIEADVVRLMQHMGRHLPPLAGLIHAAGVLDDGVLTQQNATRFARVLGPKVLGAWNLHRHTLHLPLDWFVCFSSVASVLGWSGQGNYAAGNAFLDTLAARRRAAGRPALSINWGPWAEAGMAAKLGDREQQRMQDSGMTPLNSGRALQAMEQLLHHGAIQAGVFDVQWDKLVRTLAAPSKKQLLKPLLQGGTETGGTSAVERLAAASAAAKPALLAEIISETLASVLGMKPGTAIEQDKSIADYGVNSLMSMDVRNRLQSVLAMKLPGTFALKYPTVNSMVEYVLANTASASSTEIIYWDPAAPHVVRNHEVNGPLAALTPSVLNWIHEGHNTHFNVGVLLEAEDDAFDLEALKIALRITLQHHDGCRSTLWIEEGRYRQEIMGLGDNAVLHEHDLSALDYESAAARMTELNNELHRSFRFERGSFLYRFAYYKLRDRAPHRLFLVFHHYISDALSQKLFGHELLETYRKVLNRQPVSFPPKSFTLIDWCQRLHSFAHDEAEKQLPEWLSKIERSRASFVPDDFTSKRARTIEDYVLHTATWDRDKYARVAEACRAGGHEIADLCVYALIRAFSRLTGAEALWVDIITHARSGIFPDVQIPDLFGQISESASVLFELQPGAALDLQLETIRTQRLEVPNGGIGLRALRFLNRNPDVRALLAKDESPQLGLNLDLTDYAEQAEQTGFRFAREPIGDKQQPHIRKKADELRLAFFICPRVRYGVFSLEIGYYRDRFHDETIARLTRDFFDALATVEGTGSTAIPPSEDVSSDDWPAHQRAASTDAAAVGA